MEKTAFKVGILDMYEGATNQGMRCITELLNQYAELEAIDISFTIYNVRQNCALPNLDYDFYISTGGPGSPIDSTGTTWENAFFAFIATVEKHNATQEVKKQILFICHSFQLACKYYNVGNLCKRKSNSFGVFPIHMMPQGGLEPIFDGLLNPFYGVDSRDYQVIDPNHKRIKEIGGQILAIEKERPHIPLPRAIMAMRFNAYFVGTQFHPEADAMGMQMYLQTEDKKQSVIASHSHEKWQSMVEQLADPEKIMWTYNHIIPNFLQMVTGELVCR
jgi:homoserine O-succinyltransferase/O-acetyltransferase